MKLNLISEIAWSLLFARWKQTLIAAIGVAFSITLFIALLGFMNGLNRLLDGLVLNRTAHIRLFNEIKPSKGQPVDRVEKYAGYYHFIYSVKPANARNEIYNVKAILKTLHSDSRVLGIAPKVSTQIFYNLGTIQLNGVINGIDVDEESRLFTFNDYVTKGNYYDLKKIPNSIILGKGAADKMLAGVGDMITVITPAGERFPLKVVGYYQSGLAELDKVQSYASMATTQKILGKSDSYMSDLQIKLKDMNGAPSVAKEYQKLFGTQAEDIQTANAQFETGSKVRSIISYSVGITLLIVAGFGIYNILNMMIYEKMDTIAILKATGFSGSDVKQIFLTIALSIGIFGTCAGYVCGFFLSFLIDQIPFNTAALPMVKTYPVDYNIKYYLIAGTFAIVTTWFAGWIPAKKASSMDPVIIIRGK